MTTSILSNRLYGPAIGWLDDMIPRCCPNPDLGLYPSGAFTIYCIRGCLIRGVHLGTNVVAFQTLFGKDYNYGLIHELSLHLPGQRDVRHGLWPFSITVMMY